MLGRHAEPVAAVAFEDPWLAVAQGSVTLVDVDAAMRSGRGGLPGGKASHKRQVPPHPPAPLERAYVVQAEK